MSLRFDWLNARVGARIGLAIGVAIVVAAVAIGQGGLYGVVMVTFQFGLPLTLVYILVDPSGAQWLWWTLVVTLPVLNWLAIGMLAGKVAEAIRRRRAA